MRSMEMGWAVCCFVLATGPLGAQQIMQYEKAYRGSSDGAGSGYHFDLVYDPAKERGCVLTKSEPHMKQLLNDQIPNKVTTQVLPDSACAIFKVAERLKAFFGDRCASLDRQISVETQGDSRSTAGSYYRRDTHVETTPGCACRKRVETDRGANLFESIARGPLASLFDGPYWERVATITAATADECATLFSDPRDQAAVKDAYNAVQNASEKKIDLPDPNEIGFDGP